MITDIDPITLEVLRHRLWMINDEQGKVACQISGSPVVYEANDFNTSLMTPEGDSLFIGLFTTRLSLCLHGAAKEIIARFSEDPGFKEGDVFVTNDPWAGALHQNDLLMVAPIFFGSQLVAWSGLAMHEVDVGGPVPGSFTVGARDVFGEGPLIPPVRLFERGTMRPDIEAWVTRNTRTRDLNRLNLRARLAAINRTRQRIHELCGEYGVETFLAAQQAIMQLVGQAFGRRLAELPDGAWSEESFLDHDGTRNELYRLKLQMTKRGERLSFDFRGTATQAPGPINCTRVGLESGVCSAVLPMLCYDMLWSPAAIRNSVEIIAAEGTLNNARHPAAVSMGSVGAAYATQHICSAAIGKMLACSTQKREAQANWTPAWQGATIAGADDEGQPFTGVLLDQSGGGGATSERDGLNASGVPGSPRMSIANVETYERLYPILYVYRKHSCDTGGPGHFRGGVGTHQMIVPHRVNGSIELTVLTHGAASPEARGLYGGLPSSVQVRLLLRGVGVTELLRGSRMPTDVSHLACGRVEPLAAKERTRLNPDDAFVAICAGGGGYGDPLERDLDQVHRDVRRGLVSPDVAETVYGAVIDNGAVARQASADLRARLRSKRLTEATYRKEYRAGTAGAPEIRAVHATIGDAMLLANTGSGDAWFCQRCHAWLCAVDEAPKLTVPFREVPIPHISPWNRYGLVEDVTVREFYCPSCALLLNVEVRRRDDAILPDTLLREAVTAAPGGSVE